MTMRRFLIRVVQVFALAIIGTSFLADTSFAAMVTEKECKDLGGEWIVDTLSYGASINNPKISCSYYSKLSDGPVTINCYQGKCMSVDCGGGTCKNFYSKGYKPPPNNNDTPPGKGRKGTTTMSGPILDRSRNPGAPTLGGW